MKPCWFHPAAMAEADEAAEFYQDTSAKLEVRFLEALNEAIQRIRENPARYRVIEGNVRKLRLLRFPYVLIYRDIEARIEVIAVMHIRRKPSYWRSRK